MKWYIRSNSEPNMYDENGEYSQEYLAYLRDTYGTGAVLDSSPEDMYELASLFTEDVATKDNYFLNSIGFWEVRKSRPRREPDYVSMNYHDFRHGGKIKKSSEYWYSSDGVIRGSDHWGSDVASCSWYLKGVRYHKNGVGVVVGHKRYAYIPWKDLKAKGYIVKHYKTGEYSIAGFKFEK